MVDRTREWLEGNSLKLKSLTSSASQGAESLSTLNDTLIPEFLNNIKENDSVLNELEETSKTLTNSLTDQGNQMLSSTNNEIKERYLRIIEDANELRIKVTESLEQDLLQRYIKDG